MLYHFIVSKIRRKLHFLISQNLTAGKWIEETKKEKKKIYQRQKTTNDFNGRHLLEMGELFFFPFSSQVDVQSSLHT